MRSTGGMQGERKPAAVRHCHNCGQEIQSRMKFCPNCGQDQSIVVPQDQRISPEDGAPSTSTPPPVITTGRRKRRGAPRHGNSGPLGGVSRKRRIGLLGWGGIGLLLLALLVVAIVSVLDGGPPGVAQISTVSTEEVVQAFRDEGLEVGESYNVEDDPDWGSGMLPKTMDEGTRFELPGYYRADAPAVGDVFHFATPEDQRVVSDYLETVGKSSGLFYTHVYETEGFMLKIDGSVPKTVADEYNEVFQQQV